MNNIYLITTTSQSSPRKILDLLYHSQYGETTGFGRIADETTKGAKGEVHPLVRDKIFFFEKKVYGTCTVKGSYFARLELSVRNI